MSKPSPIWPAYVINMAQNTTRMENVTTQLTDQNISFVRINGVDGRKLSQTEIEAVYDSDANRRRGKYPLVPPEIGCYLSHINTWRAIADGSAPGGFVFEDDFKASRDLHQVLTALSTEETNWDMVKLFAFNPAVTLANVQELTQDHLLGFPYKVPTCLIGYAITKLAAQHLVNRATANRFFRPVDEDQKYTWETGLRVALVSPPPIKIGDQNAQSGTVGGARRADTFSGIITNLRKIARVFWYAIRYNIRLYLHKRKDPRS